MTNVLTLFAIFPLVSTNFLTSNTLNSIIELIYEVLNGNSFPKKAASFKKVKTLHAKFACKSVERFENDGQCVGKSDCGTRSCHA